MYTHKNRISSLLITIMLLVSGNMSLCMDNNEDDVVEGEVYRFRSLVYLGKSFDRYWKDKKVTIGSDKSDMVSIMKNNPAVVVSRVAVGYERNNEASKKLLSRYKDVLMPEGPGWEFYLPLLLLKELISRGNLSGKACKEEKCIKFKLFIKKENRERFEKELNFVEQQFSKIPNYYAGSDKKFLLEHGVISRDPETEEDRHGPNGYKKEKIDEEGEKKD